MCKIDAPCRAPSAYTRELQTQRFMLKCSRCLVVYEWLLRQKLALQAGRLPSASEQRATSFTILRNCA